MYRLVMLLVLLLACAGLSRLGLWQLDRAEQKRQLFDAYHEAHAAAPLDFNTLGDDIEPKRYAWRRAHISGELLDVTVLLDNRTREGRAGYEVINLLRAASGQVVMLNRGWMPLPQRRSQVPALSKPAGQFVAEGFLGPMPVVGIDIGEQSAGADRMTDSVYRVQRITPGNITALLGEKVAPLMFFLTKPVSAGFETDWRLPGDGSSKHTAYAVQWFAMAVVLFLIGMWQLVVRNKQAMNDERK